MTVQKDMEAVKIFAKKHLYDCVKDVLEWGDTSVLRAGKLRELAAMLYGIAGGDHFNLARAIVTDEALRSLIKHIDYQRMT